MSIYNTIQFNVIEKLDTIEETWELLAKKLN